MLKFWNGNLEVVEIDSKFYVLGGWNGELYMDCMEVDDRILNTFYICISNSECEIRPINKQIDEDDFDIIGYEVL